MAKPASGAQPYAVANEVVCGALARVLNLPCPPGFIVQREDTPYHVSLNFNLSGEDLPPADAEAVVAQFPGLSWGIILFDVWIVNGDRHAKNLSYDRSRDAVQVFDHSHALLSGKTGSEHLKNNVDSLGIGERENGPPKHCIAKEVTGLQGLTDWAERIRGVPEYYVREAVAKAVSVGLPEDEEDFCADFLVSRQERVEELVENHKGSFPKLQPDLWSQDDGEDEGAEADENGGAKEGEDE